MNQGAADVSSEVWDAPTYAEDLLPGSWPSADEEALRTQALRCRGLADHIRQIGGDIERARSEYAHGRGVFAENVDLGLHRIVGADTGTGATADRLDVMAGRLDRFADVVADTRRAVSAIAAITDRDVRRAELLAILGDDSARVVAASSGRLALTAAGDDYTDRADAAGKHEPGALDTVPAAATSGMMPFAPMGALGALGAGVAAGRAASGTSNTAVSSEDLETTDLVWLRRRAERLGASVAAGVGGWLRTAVGLGVSDRGRRVVVVGTNDPQPYQRRGMTLADDEALTADGRAPELAVVDHMQRTGTTPRAVASATPMAPGVVSALRAADVAIVGPD